MKLNISFIAAIVSTTSALAIGERQEAGQETGLFERGCDFIDKADCHERYWACQQDNIPSAINWYALTIFSFIKFDILTRLCQKSCNLRPMPRSLAG